MPLFYQHDLNRQTKLAVWKIEEDEAFFAARASVQRSISHPHKRLQHLAGRYLLAWLFPGFPSWLIRIADTRKPFLEGTPYHFSISHSENFAAAIVSTDCSVGIDVELASQKIFSVSHKFLSAYDARSLSDASGGENQERDRERLTIAWSAKEAMYKWYGKGEVDFKEDMLLDGWQPGADGGQLSCTFRKDLAVQLRVQYKLFDSLVLAWLAAPLPPQTPEGIPDHAPATNRPNFYHPS